MYCEKWVMSIDLESCWENSIMESFEFNPKMSSSTLIYCRITFVGDT